MSKRGAGVALAALAVLALSACGHDDSRDKATEEIGHALACNLYEQGAMSDNPGKC